MNSVKVLILEDDPDFLQLLNVLLNQIGIANAVTTDSPTECLHLISTEKIELCLLDINLGKGKQDGIEVAQNIRKQHPDLPIIFLTSMYDDKYYQKSKAVRPAAFLDKQLNKLKLQQAIELAIQEKKNQASAYPPQTIEKIFVKVGDNYKAIPKDKISYFVADKKLVYCVVDNRKYPIRMTLKEVENKLGSNFIRVHRAYIVNIDLVDTINLMESSIKVNNGSIPLGPSYKNQLINRVPWFK